MLGFRRLRAIGAIALCTASACAVNASVVNGGFETGTANAPPTGWTDTDTFFGFSRCSLAVCGNSVNSTGPATGSFYIWFGGSPFAQTAVLSQNAVLEASAGLLLFDLWTGLTIGNASLSFSIDSTTLFTVTQANAATYAGGYSTVSIPLGAFANGSSHTILWNYSDAATTSVANTNWSLDNVRLAPSAVPEPGSLALVGAAALGLAAVRRRRNATA